MCYKSGQIYLLPTVLAIMLTTNNLGRPHIYRAAQPPRSAAGCVGAAFANSKRREHIAGPLQKLVGLRRNLGSKFNLHRATETRFEGNEHLKAELLPFTSHEIRYPRLTDSEPGSSFHLGQMFTLNIGA